MPTRIVVAWRVSRLSALPGGTIVETRLGLATVRFATLFMAIRLRAAAMLGFIWIIKACPSSLGTAPFVLLFSSGPAGLTPCSTGCLPPTFAFAGGLCRSRELPHPGWTISCSPMTYSSIFYAVMGLFLWPSYTHPMPHCSFCASWMHLHDLLATAGYGFRDPLTGVVAWASSPLASEAMRSGNHGSPHSDTVFMWISHSPLPIYGLEFIISAIRHCFEARRNVSHLLQ